MKIVKTYEEGEYTINEYDNGVKEKYLTAHPPNRGGPDPNFKPVMPEEQVLQYQTAINVEMLLSMTELSI